MLVAASRTFSLLRLLALGAALTGCGQHADSVPGRAGGPPGIALAQGGAVPGAATAAASEAGAGQPAQVFLMAGSISGDGNTDGYMLAAHFRDPDGVAGDAYGNIFVADTGNHTIRRITPNGMVSTVAGKAGEAGSRDGEGGQARFNTPMGLRIDSAGNLFVADSGNHTIRRIAPDGMVTTMAGKAGEAGAMDGSPGVGRLQQPARFAIGPDGVLYVADAVGGAIRKVAPDGMIATLAVGAPMRNPVDGSLVAKPLSGICAIAADLSGNLYITNANLQMVLKISTDGQVSHVAGKTNQWDPDISEQIDGAGAQAQFARPGDIVTHWDGSLTVVDYHTVRRISAEGVVTTPPRFNRVSLANNYTALALDRDGAVLMANRNYEEHHVRSAGLSAIYRLHGDGGLTLVAPRPLAAPALSQYGTALPSFGPAALAAGPAGKLYVAGYAALHWLDALGRFVTVPLRAYGAGSISNPSPRNMGMDGAGNAYLVEHGIYKVTPDGWVLVVPAGLDYGGIAVARDGTIYATTVGQGAIYVIREEREPELFAGVPGVLGNGDGPREAATFGRLGGIALDGAGNLYVADTGNHTVRKIGVDGMVTTVAGRTGIAGDTDGGGATLRSPWYITTDHAGNVYVAEQGGYTVRRIARDGAVATVAGKLGSEGIALDSLGRIWGLAGAEGVVYIISDGALLKLIL